MLDIRLAELNDAQLINKLAWIAFPATYKEMLLPEQIEYMMNWMYSVSTIESLIKNENHNFYIAYSNDEPCGYLHIEKEETNIFKLQKIYVLPNFQGLNIGKFLFYQAISEIKKINPDNCLMKLNVNRDNKAVNFYEKMGMKKIGTGDFEIGNGFYMNDYIMGVEI